MRFGQSREPLLFNHKNALQYRGGRSKAVVDRRRETPAAAESLAAAVAAERSLAASRNSAWGRRRLLGCAESRHAHGHERLDPRLKKRPKAHFLGHLTGSQRTAGRRL